MQRISTVIEVWQFLKENRAWWLFPILLVLIVIGTLIGLTSGSALAPFIYSIF
jgi:hypothetical protein